MKIIILTMNKKLSSLARLAHSAKSLGHQCTIMDVTEQKLELSTPSDEELIILNRISGTNYSDEDLLYLSSLPKNIKVVNDPEHTMIFRDKALQYKFYLKNKIKTIPTLDLEHSSEQKVNLFTHKFMKSKFLLKPKRSNQGLGIIQCRSKEELCSQIELLKIKADTRYIVQPFLKKVCEWRILYIKGKLICAMKKEHPKNYTILNCANADLIPIENSRVPDELKELCHALYLYSGLHIMACDILITPEGEGLLIETNTIPGLSFVEATCGIDVAKLIINSLKT